MNIAPSALIFLPSPYSLCEDEQSPLKYISTHAPAIGATDRVQYIAPQPAFTAPTPARIATAGLSKVITFLPDLIQAPARWCDATSDIGNSRNIVSIHAPTWDVTHKPVHTLYTPHVSIHASTWLQRTRTTPHRMRTRFNPHTPMGCDKYAFEGHDSWLWFQSTHPRGVRPPVSPEFPQM